MGKKKVRIEEWGLIGELPTPYSAPELEEYMLTGKVYGHPNFSDGHSVRTSRILGALDGCVETMNTLYDLGEPSEEYKSAMKDKNNLKERLLSKLTTK